MTDYPGGKDRPWDKRAWLVATYGVVGETALAVLTSYPFASVLVIKKVHVVFWTTDLDTLAIIGFFALLLVMPVVLTVLARRTPFLWGALPFVAVEIYTAIYDILYRHELWPTSKDVGQLTFIPLWLVLSGIGLGIRAMTRRRKLRPEAVLAGVTNRAGMWPPAPKPDDEGSTTPPSG